MELHVLYFQVRNDYVSDLIYVLIYSDACNYHNNGYFFEKEKVQRSEKMERNNKHDCVQDMQLVSSTTSPNQITYRSDAMNVSNVLPMMSEQWEPGEILDCNKYPRQGTHHRKMNFKRRLQVIRLNITWCNLLLLFFSGNYILLCI